MILLGPAFRYLVFFICLLEYKCNPAYVIGALSWLCSIMETFFIPSLHILISMHIWRCGGYLYLWWIMPANAKGQVDQTFVS